MHDHLFAFIDELLSQCMRLEGLSYQQASKFQASVQTRQSLRCLHALSMDQNERSCYAGLVRGLSEALKQMLYIPIPGAGTFINYNNACLY